MSIAETKLAAEWTRTIAPESGDVRTELVQEAAEFLGIPLHESWRRLRGAGERFRDEWATRVADPSDAGALTEFYNQSDTELFELIEWHANDPIHYRTLIVRDIALARTGRRHLDYGSGIGNDALTLAASGFDVTLADISDCLLAFAAWRLRRRGFTARAIDLKHSELPVDSFDLVTCFDVLEHIPRPLDVVRAIRRALRPEGLFVMHAPFGEDPVHPMHVVHEDVVTPRMRSLGFQPLDCWFPPFVRAPYVYQKRDRPALERAGYLLYDRYFHNELGARLAAAYRRAFRRAKTGTAPAAHDQLLGEKP
jgi:2-polyprenyl-3-methyl-5-hydroxy-6-metoxy-1,4-benzoquinol methylase